MKQQVPLKQRVPLREIASARAGDKGDISNIAIWAYDAAHFPAIAAQLTAERVKAAFPDLFRGRVERHMLEGLSGLNFVLHEGLEGGVNTSLNLDSHGKSFSFLLLDLEIEIDA